MGLHDLSAQEVLNLQIAGLGFKRIADTATHVAGAGSHTDVAEFVNVRAVGGAVVFATGCVASDGDAPANTDSLLEGGELRCRLTTIKLTSGVAYAYYR